MDRWRLLIFQLDEIRTKKGITQKEVSKETGIPQGHVSRFFSAKSSPNIRTVIIIAEAIEVTLEIK